ncbi:hypothetical protein Tco_0559062 [Tanacetum coccineum]
MVFSLFIFFAWELEKDVVTLLKQIRKFSVAQDIGARAAVHIFNRISFAIAKGVGAQLVSRLTTNFLFSVTQDIGARVAVHIFNRIGLLLLEEWGPR